MGDVPFVSDEEMQALLAGAKDYSVVVLRPLPARGEEGADAIVREHGRRNLGLRAQGALAIVVPVGAEDLSGLAIFDRSVEETRAIMEGDPAVRAGLFSYSVHEGWSFPGDALPG